MKKLFLLAVCFSMAYAEEPMTTPPSEELAKQEIDNFLTEEPADQVQLSSTPLPSSSLPETETHAVNVELSSEEPVIPSETLAAPSDLEIETAPSIIPQILMNPEEDIAAIEKEEKEVAQELKSEGIVIDMNQVLSGSPTIYTILFFLSIASLGIGAYAFASLRTPELLPEEPLQAIREKLKKQEYDDALKICDQNTSILFQMVSSGIKARHQGIVEMKELMKSEGKSASSSYWQKISLLNDIAVIAPMLGLLGTVLGMFYAFYDLNRSMESISALFDGLGISVGTTVAGLIVAILAILFHTATKHRLMRQLVRVESEANTLVNLIDTKGSL